MEVWGNGADGAGLWLVAANGSDMQLVHALGRKPLWVNGDQIVCRHSSSDLSITVLIAKDKSLPTTTAWPTAAGASIVDENGVMWLLNVLTGKILPRP